MAGMYVHIPFCRKVCFYCDFHFTVSLKNKNAIVEGIKKEVTLREKYVDNNLQTIYLGGGTPSVLSVKELSELFETFYEKYDVAEDAEITIETNPDDLTEEYLRDLKKYTPVNRLSVGIQSFNDKHLIWMNRRHTASESIKCIENSHKAGFHNITGDLIYGIPTSTLEEWKQDLQQMFDLGIQHISAYHLTIEPDTILGRRHKKGLVKEVNEDISYHQFELLLEMMAQKGYDHYEISNFAKPGYISKHNTNYWKQAQYIGLGPSAHSFNGKSRQWNVRVNTEYIDKINQGSGYFEKEDLSDNDLFNEYVMLSLRTKWGVNTNYLKANFKPEYLEHFTTASQKFIESEDMYLNDNGAFVLTQKGKFISDYVVGEVFRSSE